MIMKKTIPMVSKPGDFCAFNGCKSSPYAITRAQAATGLISVRDAVRRGNARLKRLGFGRYEMHTFDTLILTTR